MSEPKYTVTVYSDEKIFNSDLLNSQGIHTWVEISDGINTEVYSYGYESGHGGEILKGAPGKFDTKDQTAIRKQQAHKITIEITSDQYIDVLNNANDLKKAVKNNPELYKYQVVPKDGNNNCVTISNKILEYAGIKLLQGADSPVVASGRICYANEYGLDSFSNGSKVNLIDAASVWAYSNGGIGRVLGKVFPFIIENYWEFAPEVTEVHVPVEDTALYKYQQEGAISPGKSIFDASQGTSITPPPRDPVTVDLDGDGVETISSENGVYFDLDASGTAEKTGWIAPDDGLVVMDRDGNGTIDNGRELFGDATVLKDGSIASTGFEALAEQDTNKDGVIDASDENFSNMKVWRDLNQDGISQSEELRSLEETGIKKIHLDYLTVNTEDEQGKNKSFCPLITLIYANYKIAI